MNDPLTDESAERLLGHVADEFFAAKARGERPTVSQFAERYPQASSLIREALPILALVGDSVGDQSTGSAGTYRPPEALGDYRIIREIGRGGMGAVYEAEQRSISRRVALKILPFASLSSDKALKRFQNEIRTAASLEHPHITAVYASGEDRGIHYFAMQLIRGQSLAEIIQQLRNEKVAARSVSTHEFKNGTSKDTNDTAPFAALSTVRTADEAAYFRRVAELGIQACDALHYAHESGVVHRDIKPSNLMIDVNGRLWLTDFGLAQGHADAGLTVTGDLIGTLRYMSPEQANGGRVLDHRTDIFSLGATLYELISLQPPFDGGERQRLLQSIVAEEPTSLRAIESRVPHDLETIVQKALEKDPADRYATAKELGEDLDRFVRGVTVRARSPSISNSIRKWGRRHVGALCGALAMSIFGVMVLFASTMFVANSRKNEIMQREIAQEERDKAIGQRQHADASRDEARLHRYYAEIAAGQFDAVHQNMSGLRLMLERQLPRIHGPDPRGWEWYYLTSLCHPEARTFRNEGGLSYAAWSPDGKLIGSPGIIRSSDSGERVRSLSPSPMMRLCVDWSANGQKLAWGMASVDNAFYIWDRPTDSLHRVPGHQGSVWCLDWSPDGSQMATGSIDHTIKIWNTADWGVLFDIPVAKNVSGVAWRPDGQLLAAAIAGRGIELINPATGKFTKSFEERSDHLSVSWQPSGKVLAAASDHRWFLIDPTSWQVILEHPLRRGGESISFSPDGQRIAVADGEIVAIWKTHGGEAELHLNGHLSKVISAAWSPSGREIITASEDNEIKTWDLESHARPATVSLKTSINSLAWLPDDRTMVATNRATGQSYAWNSRDNTIKESKLGDIKNVNCVSKDGKLAAEYKKDQHAIWITEIESGSRLSVLQLPTGNVLSSCTFSANSSRLAVISHRGSRTSVSCWDVESERIVSSWDRDVLSNAVGLDFPTWDEGALIAVVGVGDIGDGGTPYWNRHLHVIDTDTGKRVLKHYPEGPQKVPVTALTWGPSTQQIALGTSEGRLEVVDVKTRRAVLSRKILNEAIVSIAWHPSSVRLACASSEGEVKLVTANTGTPLLTFDIKQPGGSELAWSSDGKRLGLATKNGDVFVWDASAGYGFASEGPRQGELAWAYFQQRAFRETIEHAPDTADYWELRGRAYAKLKDYRRASDEFAKVISTTRPAFRAAVDRAYCLLAAHDQPRYEEACKSLISEFGDSLVLSNRSDIASMCVVCPPAGVDFDKFIAHAQAQADLKGPWIEAQKSILGGCLLRTGQFQRAVTILTEVAQSRDRDGDRVNYSSLASTQYYLAIARHGLGEDHQASRLFAAANRNADLAQSLNMDFKNEIGLEILRSEVAEALNVPTK